jgi:REP element-mobilizing transposase RayT
VFVTCCTQSRRACLDRVEVHAALRESWQAADRWIVGRYVVMPDHIHLFCAPTPNAGSLSRWMGYWRGMTTRALGEPSGQLWQRDYWDRQLRRADSYAEKWEYVRHNPVRAQLAQLAEDWPFQGELNRLEWFDER